MIIQIIGRRGTNFDPFDGIAHPLHIADEGEGNVHGLGTDENKDFIAHFFQFAEFGALQSIEIEKNVAANLGCHRWQ